MARELLILRHGKSDWGAGVDDFHRPLKARGKRGAERIGVWLWQQGLRPAFIVSSPAARAIDTAHRCCQSMGLGDTTVTTDQRIYEASPNSLLRVLADAPADADRVMLVGHNPGLEQLLLRLADNEILPPEDGKLMPTATLARLRTPDDWRRLGDSCAKLVGIVRARDLPEGFPYPAPDGDEVRSRPAHYYTQSGVIPYRIGKGGQLEFLLIRASSNRHWVVPKGIVDPGLTSEQAAAKEALEEAGVRGVIGRDPLGSYRTKKWGASCSVEVYAMRVTEILAVSTWEENHRDRRWCTAPAAAAGLKQPELGAMVLALAKALRG